MGGGKWREGKGKLRGRTTSREFKIVSPFTRIRVQIRGCRKRYIPRVKTPQPTEKVKRARKRGDGTLKKKI